MEATRVRFESLFEWAVAAAFIVAILAAGSVVVREFRTVTGTPVIAREPVQLSEAPAGVPSRAVSVPMLLLPGGTEVHVGDPLATIASRLGKQAAVGPDVVEPAPTGQRLTRAYARDGAEFILVFEPFEAGGKPRVAAIYLK
jgi:hypothetical protein